MTSRSSTWPNTPASSVRRKTKSVRRDAARRGERANVLGYSLVRMGKLSRGVQTIVSPILKIEIGSAMGKGFAPNQRQSLFGKSCEDADDGERTTKTAMQKIACRMNSLVCRSAIGVMKFRPT